MQDWLKNEERFADLFNVAVYDGKQVISKDDLEVVDSAYSYIILDYKINTIEPDKIRDVNLFKSDLRTVFGVIQCRKDKQKSREYISAN